MTQANQRHSNCNRNLHHERTRILQYDVDRIVTSLENIWGLSLARTLEFRQNGLSSVEFSPQAIQPNTGSFRVCCLFLTRERERERDILKERREQQQHARDCDCLSLISTRLVPLGLFGFYREESSSSHDR